MAIQTPVTTPPITPGFRLAGWRFWLPLALQLLIVLAVPMPKLAAYAWGTPVVLSIQPVDPYDLLRGRYVRLGYEVASPTVLEGLPGWHRRFLEGDRTLYVTLAPGQPNAPWRPTAIAEARPAALPPGAVVLKGRMKDGALDLGLGEYYMNEAVGDEAEAGLRRAPGSARVEVRVDGEGNAVLAGMWIDGKRY